MIPEEYLSDENLDKVQMGLAASGMVPGPTGIASDVADAGISIGRGDLLGALLAGGAAIPGLGMAFGARGGRHLGKLRGGKLAQGMLPEEVAMLRQADEGAALRHADEGADLERAMTRDETGEMFAAADEVDESLIAEIGDGLQKHGVTWDEAVESGKAELQKTYSSLMDMQEGGGDMSVGLDIAKIEAIHREPDTIAEFALNRLEGRSFEESVESTLTTIQARELPYGAPPSAAAMEQGEEDLLRQMTSDQGESPTLSWEEIAPDEIDPLRSDELERLGGEEDFPYPFREPPMTETEGSPDPLRGLFKDIDLDPTE